MIDYASIFRSFMRGRMHPLYEVMYSGLLRYAAQMLGDDLSYLAECAGCGDAHIYEP